MFYYSSLFSFYNLLFRFIIDFPHLLLFVVFYVGVLLVLWGFSDLRGFIKQYRMMNCLGWIWIMLIIIMKDFI